jgi:hypothetical protein
MGSYSIQHSAFSIQHSAFSIQPRSILNDNREEGAVAFGDLACFVSLPALTCGPTIFPAFGTAFRCPYGVQIAKPIFAHVQHSAMTVHRKGQNGNKIPAIFGITAYLCS